MTDERYDDRQVWLPALYREQWVPMVRLAALLVAPDRPEVGPAEELVRDALVGMYQDDPTFHSWPHVVGTLRAGVVSASRGVQRTLDEQDDAADDLLDEEPGEPTEPGTAEAQPLDVLAALGRMPHRQREVLVLELYAGIPVAEAADALGVTRRAVRRRSERALAELSAICVPPEGQDLEEAAAQRLRSSAEQLAPGDRLPEVLHLTRMVKPRVSWWNRIVVAAVLLAATAAGFGLSTLWGGTGDQADPRSSGAASPSGLAASSSDSSVATMQTGIQVFYLGRSDGLLYREMRSLPTMGDRLGTAVAAVLNVAPLDPEYTSSWSGGQVNDAYVRGDRITLDLSQSAFAQFKSRNQEESAVQQLVYAATAAVDGGEHKWVRILVDGSPNLPLIGKPETDFRRAGLAALGPLWVDDPEAGTTLPPGPLMISGLVKSDLPSPTWQLYRSSTKKVVAKGPVVVQPGNGPWAAWHQQITLPAAPGEFRLMLTVGDKTIWKTITVK